MRWRSMKSRSGSPSALRTTCSSHTFSASVLPIASSTKDFDFDLQIARPVHRVGADWVTSHRLALASHDLRRQYCHMDNSSGVGVLDKAALVLAALEAGQAPLAGLVAGTGLARPTAHRLAEIGSASRRARVCQYGWI